MLTLIAARALNPFALQTEHNLHIISNCSKVLPPQLMFGNLWPRASRQGKGKQNYPLCFFFWAVALRAILAFQLGNFSSLTPEWGSCSGNSLQSLIKTEGKKNLFKFHYSLPFVIRWCNVSTQKRKTGRGPRFASELGTIEHGRRWTKKEERNEVMKWERRTKSH